MLWVLVSLSYEYICNTFTIERLAIRLTYWVEPPKPLAAKCAQTFTTSIREKGLFNKM